MCVVKQMMEKHEREVRLELRSASRARSWKQAVELALYGFMLRRMRATYTGNCAHCGGKPRPAALALRPAAVAGGQRSVPGCGREAQDSLSAQELTTSD